MTAATPGFGECTKTDLAELDAALKRVAAAEATEAERRLELAEVFRRLLDKGAQRKAIADRAGYSSHQTVTNIAYGRPTRSTNGNK